MIFLDEVAGFIIVNVVRYLLYQQRLRPVVVVAEDLCYRVLQRRMYGNAFGSGLTVKGSDPRDRKEFPHGL